mgnify:CR=1 FL=1
MNYKAEQNENGKFDVIITIINVSLVLINIMLTHDCILFVEDNDDYFSLKVR